MCFYPLPAPLPSSSCCYYLIPTHPLPCPQFLIKKEAKTTTIVVRAGGAGRARDEKRDNKCGGREDAYSRDRSSGFLTTGRMVAGSAPCPAAYSVAPRDISASRSLRSSSTHATSACTSSRVGLTGTSVGGRSRSVSADAAGPLNTPSIHGCAPCRSEGFTVNSTSTGKAESPTAKANLTCAGVSLRLRAMAGAGEREGESREGQHTGRGWQVCCSQQLLWALLCGRCSVARERREAPAFLLQASSHGSRTSLALMEAPGAAPAASAAAAAPPQPAAASTSALAAGLKLPPLLRSVCTPGDASLLAGIVASQMDARLVAMDLRLGSKIDWAAVAAAMQASAPPATASSWLPPKCQRVWRMLAYGVDAGAQAELLPDSDGEGEDVLPAPVSRVLGAATRGGAAAALPPRLGAALGALQAPTAAEAEEALRRTFKGVADSLTSAAAAGQQAPVAAAAALPSAPPASAASVPAFAPPSALPPVTETLFSGIPEVEALGLPDAQREILHAHTLSYTGLGPGPAPTAFDAFAEAMRLDLTAAVALKTTELGEVVRVVKVELAAAQGNAAAGAAGASGNSSVSGVSASRGPKPTAADLSALKTRLAEAQAALGAIKSGKYAHELLVDAWSRACASHPNVAAACEAQARALAAPGGVWATAAGEFRSRYGATLVTLARGAARLLEEAAGAEEGSAAAAVAAGVRGALAPPKRLESAASWSMPVEPQQGGSSGSEGGGAAAGGAAEPVSAGAAASHPPRPLQAQAEALLASAARQPLPFPGVAEAGPEAVLSAAPHTGLAVRPSASVAPGQAAAASEGPAAVTHKRLQGLNEAFLAEVSDKAGLAVAGMVQLTSGLQGRPPAPLAPAAAPPR